MTLAKSIFVFIHLAAICFLASFILIGCSDPPSTNTNPPLRSDSQTHVVRSRSNQQNGSVTGIIVLTGAWSNTKTRTPTTEQAITSTPRKSTNTTTPTNKQSDTINETCQSRTGHNRKKNPS